VLAFAGIADPEKFFRTVESLGGVIAIRRPFGDHQHLSEDEIGDLLATAAAENLEIVTTAKDAVRLIGHHGRAAELLEKAKVIEVEMAFDSPATPGLIVQQAVAVARRRGARKRVA
jgi:tetraacyldisaccharide 4'-kinase